MKRKSVIGILICFISTCFCLSQSLFDEGTKLFTEKKYQEAKSVFEQVLKSHSHKAEANYFLGKTHFELGDFDEAEDFLQAAIEVDDRRIDYHLALATVYQEKTRAASFISAPFLAKKWLEQLETAFSLDTHHLDARRRLIQYYLNAPGIGGGDKEKGTRLAEETIKLDELQGRLLYASALSRTDKQDSAIEEYKKVLKLDPQNGSVYNLLGYIYLKRKDFAAAEIHFKKYIDVAPQSPNAYDSMGDYYLERGMLDDAIVRFEKALDIDANSSESRFKLAETFVKKNLKKEARYHLQTLLKLTPRHFRVEDAKELLDELED